MILVGDSLGMTMLGYDSTLPVTMNDMIRHTQAVRRGVPNVFLIGDMPYMTYQMPRFSNKRAHFAFSCSWCQTGFARSSPNGPRIA